MAKLTKKEITELKIRLNEYLTTSPTDKLNIIDEFLLNVRNIEIARMWFNKFPHVQLEQEHLDAVYKKYNSWEITKTIITNQRSLSSEDITKFYNKLGTMGSMIYQTMTMMTKLDKKFRLEIVEKIFKESNINIHRSFVEIMAREIMSSDNLFWEDAFDILIKYINNGDLRSEHLADFYKEYPTFNYIAYSKDVISPLLYDVTGDENYLSKEVQDVFLF